MTDPQSPPPFDRALIVMAIDAAAANLMMIRAAVERMDTTPLAGPPPRVCMVSASGQHERPDFDRPDSTEGLCLDCGERVSRETLDGDLGVSDDQADPPRS